MVKIVGPGDGAITVETLGDNVVYLSTINPCALNDKVLARRFMSAICKATERVTVCCGANYDRAKTFLEGLQWEEVLAPKNIPCLQEQSTFAVLAPAMEVPALSEDELQELRRNPDLLFKDPLHDC